jgi:hypothetical protein
MNDPDLDQLLHLARGTAPRAGSKDRLRSRILAGAAAGGVATVAAHAAGAGKASVLTAAVSKAGGGVLLSFLACVGGGVALGLVVIGPALSNHQPSPAPQGSRVVAATDPSASVPAPGAALPPDSATPPAARANLTRSSNPPPVPSRSASAEAPLPSIERETSLLAEAQRALRRHDAAAALGFLDAYDREFPSGALSEEASAARAVSWCSLGRKTEGLRALGNFRAAYPGSPLLARVKAACRNLDGHDDFELESSNPSTQSNGRSDRPAQ